MLPSLAIVLQFSGRSVAKLARQSPAPIFIYSAQRIKYNLLRLKVALNEVGLKNRNTLPRSNDVCFGALELCPAKWD